MIYSGRNKLFQGYSMTVEEQKKLMDRYFNGEVGLRDKLILSYYPLVVTVLNNNLRYKKPGYEDDIMSVGTIGLIKAFDKFNPNNGNSFTAFAAIVILNDVRMYLRHNKHYFQTMHIEDNLTTDDSEDAFTLYDMMHEDEDLQPEKVIEYKNLYSHALKVIDEELSEKEKIVIKELYLSDKKRTQKEIASLIGSSQCMVSRIKDRALNKIRKAVCAE